MVIVDYNEEAEATYIKYGLNSAKLIHERHNVPLDEAMEMTGFGKFNIMMLVFCGSLMMGMILETLGFSYIIPASQCDLQLSASMKGWVAAIPFVGFILTSHLWGWIADSKGRKKALFMSMSVGSTLSVLSSLAPEVYSFIVLRLCAACFIAGGAALGYAFMGEFSPSSHRDKMIALANASVALGTAIVPLIAWAVLPSDFRLPFWGMDYRPWRLLICCFAAPYAVCAIIILMLPESPKFLASKGRRAEALNVLVSMFKMNTGKDIQEYQVFSLADEAVEVDAQQSALLSLWLQTRAMFTRQWIASSCLVCSLQFTTFAIGNGFYIWLPEVINRIWSGQTDNSSVNLCTIITNLKHYDNQNSSKYIMDINEPCDDSLRTEAFTVTILISAAITIFTCSVAFSIQHIGKKPVLIAIFSTAACCSFALHWTTNVVASVILFCSFQLCSTAVGLVNAFVVQIYPTHMRAMAVCVAMMFGRIGSMVFSKGIGTLLEVNCPSCFFTASVLLAATAMLTFLLPEKKLCEIKT